MDKASSPADQRSYFRINDTLRLTWRKVSGSAPQTTTDLSSELETINDQLSRVISLAYQDSAPVGSALGLINRKLDLLLGGGSDEAAPLQTTKVSLSGAGIGFEWDDEPAQAGETIEIELILQPSNVSVTVKAGVVGCEVSGVEGGRWWIKAAFEDGQDIAIEQIIQHVSYRQTQLLSSQRRRQQLDDELHGD